LDLVDVQLAQEGACKGFEVLSGFDQPLQHRIRIELEHPRRAPHAAPLGETGNDGHDEGGR
jgi:hypothetical protein